MDQEKQTRPTHLFTVRIWLEIVDDGRTEWRGRVEHVLSGERHYFRDWASLITHLLSMLQAVEDEESETMIYRSPKPYTQVTD